MRTGKVQSSVEDVIWATPLYKFLRECNASPLRKIVLDCGAGGGWPPLALFYQHGYKTYGIEIDGEPLAKVKRFCEENHMPLNICRGDMRMIPFADESFSFVYSYNSINFMTKPDIAIAMDEIERVLKPNGLCYVNFLSEDDPLMGHFSETAPIRRLLRSEGFSHYKDDEADGYFRNFEIVRKENKLINKLYRGERLKQTDVEYIARKR